MARSTTTIFNEIIAAKNADANLSELNSGSATALYRLWAWIVAAVAYSVEVLFDAHKVAVDEQVNARQLMTRDWYADQMLKFQNGHELKVKKPEYRPYYETVDGAAQIIKAVACVETNGQLLVKVAKESGGVYAPLSTPEKAAATAYLNAIKVPGVDTTLNSQAPDLLWFNMIIYYNAQMDLTALKADVEAAIDGYVMDGIPFNGKFNVNKLVDAIQAVSDSIDPQVNFIRAKADGGSYANIVREYTAVAGYFKIDPAYPINNIAQVNYIAQ